MRALAIVVALLASCSANDDVPAPSVASVTPDHAAAGEVVTVNGSYFCQQPEGVSDDPNCDVSGTVDFGQVPATPTSWMDTALTVQVPTGLSGTVQVTVLASGQESNGVSFTVAQ